MEKICKTTEYYQKCVGFLQNPPESDFTTFAEEGGFSYINEELGLAIALERASKSNYTTIIIFGGTVEVVTKHSFAKACDCVRKAITNARKG